MSKKFIVTGIGTEVGKTIASAILVHLLSGDYWKPIECGNEEEKDSKIMKKLIDPRLHTVYPPAYSLQMPVSPHQAARAENVVIEPKKIYLPKTEKPLIIETAGGLMVPLNQKILNIDLFQLWEAAWILVSRHYLGSINHTLLTVDQLKTRGVNILGLIFNGLPQKDTEEAILSFTQLPLLGRLLPEQKIESSIIKKYAFLWKASF
ncbi:MAG: dethiobiotin synthase [Chlamydiales bacterium 38-26]|nr:dethiobiotin synthase [Chlamydiales bacterium]OJV08164.1 MAG: dethiobiotin synthase [Chlamydiales bacterium 38-26]